MRFFRNFFISQPIKLKFGTEIQNWMLILIFLAQKVVLGKISDNITQNNHFTSLFGQMPLRDSIVMATPKVPGDQKLLERVCYTLKLKVTSFIFLHLTAKKQQGGGANLPPPVQNRIKNGLSGHYISSQAEA